MKLFRNSQFLLLGILLLGTLLRLYGLGGIPAGLHRDEAFLGYNAYSILKTGRDMNGDFLPLHLRSFINSPAGYSYATILPIATFGLNAFSVRLPAALFGIATIYLTYLLAKELSKSERVALVSSALLAISPWHINLSRTSTENVLVVFFITLGCYLYARWLTERNVLRLVGAFASFGLTMLLYQAPRAFLPLYIPLLVLLTLPKAKQHIQLILFLACLFIYIPLLLILTSPTLSLRLHTVGIPASGNVQLMIEESIREDGVAHITPLVSRTFHNKALGFTGQFLENYFSHWSYSFLFTDKGLPDRYRVPSTPLVYFIELPLLLIGLILLVTKKSWQSKLLLGWILIAPIGSSLAFDDVPNLQRTLVIFPALSIIAAIGAARLTPLIRTVIATVYVASIVVYLHAYYVHLPSHRPWFRHEGYEELVSEIQKRKLDYPSIVITNRETAPTIFFLFYSAYDPARFQQQTVSIAGDDRDRTSFNKYVFTTEECPLREVIDESGIKTLTGSKDTLYVNFGTCEIPADTQELATIRRGDGSAVFRVMSVASE